MAIFNIEEELKKLPSKPGVYLMHDDKDAIIYVGKAISLKNRVRQYFQSSRNKGVKIEQMVTHIARFEYIITDSELEALVLECNLIKEHRPKYNTMLMDDKTYPFIKVTVQEDFPRVLFARQMYKDKAKYYGPYTSAGAVKDTIDLIHKLYGIRTCNKQLPKMQGKERPCLNYHIHQCPAPCQGYISKEEYAKSVKKGVCLVLDDKAPDGKKSNKVFYRKLGFEKVDQPKPELKILPNKQTKGVIKDIIETYLRKEGQAPVMTAAQKILKIGRVIDQQISPQLQKDGGDIELIDVEGNKVKVKLTGMCSGCKNAAMTLKAFVESVLKDKVDSSLEVEQV